MDCSRGSLYFLVVIVMVISGCIANSTPPPSTLAPTTATTPQATRVLPPVTTILMEFPHEYDGIKFEGNVEVNSSLQTVHALDLLDFPFLTSIIKWR